jgi:hypothetical protein
MSDDAETSRPLSRIEITRTAEIRLALDDEKIEAIKNCLAKGTLTIRMQDVDLNRAGRIDAPYLYD